MTSSVEDSLECLAMLWVLNTADESLSQFDDCLLGRLQLLRENLTRPHQLVGLLLAISFLDELGHVLDID